MDTKLSNNVEYFNTHFPADFAEFLIANNFSCSKNKTQLLFEGNDMRLVVQDNQVDLFVFYPGEEGQENEKWSYEQSHVGISHLNLFGWIFLLHIMGVLKISEFMSNARKAGIQETTEASFLVETAFKGPLKKTA